MTDRVALARIEPISDIGLRLFFNDGQQRGMGPWAIQHQLALGPN
ncbi:MAG TPA: hypothetical protein VJ652_20925 [Noviherbaspirillum sp.]|nr:hypothetical protein [Noviherbaspirillum sp.]